MSKVKRTASKSSRKCQDLLPAFPFDMVILSSAQKIYNYLALQFPYRVVRKPIRVHVFPSPPNFNFSQHKNASGVSPKRSVTISICNAVLPWATPHYIILPLDFLSSSAQYASYLLIPYNIMKSLNSSTTCDCLSSYDYNEYPLLQDIRRREASVPITTKYWYHQSLQVPKDS